MKKTCKRQISGLPDILQETYQGNRVVKAYGMEDYDGTRFNRELRRLFRIYMRVARTRSLTGRIMEVMGAFAIVAVLLWGAHSVLTGVRTPGTFGSFIGAMLLIYQPFKRLMRINNNVQAGLAAAERVFEMMDAPVEVPDDLDGAELGPGAHTIRFEHVNFRYGKEWVLRDIALEIGAGHVVALVGVSCGGKSTLADLIPRFYDVQEGRITIGRVDIRRYRLASLRAQIGLLTQHTFLFNYTVPANIGYGRIEKGLDPIIPAAQTPN